MALTHTAIRSLKAGPKATDHAVGGGLYVRVYPSGKKAFVYRSRVGGKQQWRTLGEFPELSLAEANQMVLSYLRDNFHNNEKTCGEAYQLWLSYVNKHYKSPEQVPYRMNKYFLPRFQSTNIKDVTRTDLADMLTAVATNAPVQANRLLGHVKQLFSYAEERGWIENSPAAKVTARSVGGKEKARDRVLTDEEVVTLISVLSGPRFHDPTRWALLLLLATGQRSGEVRGMTRQHVINGMWRIPASTTKNGTAQNVYLPGAFAALLKKMFAELGDEPFAGMEGQTLARAVKRMGVTWTPHDLRRTMATRMADMGIFPHVIEKCLNHTMAGVMAVYNRSEYAAEKKQAWRMWIRWLLKRRPPRGAGVEGPTERK